MANWKHRKLVSATVCFAIRTDTMAGYRAACRALRKQLGFATNQILIEDAYVVGQVGRARVTPSRSRPRIRPLKGD
jgi:hypothetical protein